MSPARDVGPRRNPFARLSVRTKVVASVLAMTALGLLATAMLTNAIQRNTVVEEVNAELDQEVAEFRRLAALGVDPDTGEPFSGVQQLLRVAIERNVPSTHEMLVTFIGESPELYSPTSARALVRDPGLRELVVDVQPSSDQVVERWLETEVGRVHAVVVPVRIEQGEEVGSYVVAAAMDRALAEQTELMRTFALVALVVLFLVGIVAWLVMGRVLRPLELLAQTAHQVGETDLHLRAPVRGDDDVAALARTFNTMLDRLSEAIETQRQFLDDAGHELRTPLTVLRGHLEVVDPQDPGDVVETRDLLLDEVARMSHIVDDLVLLAKAERPESFAPEPLDLGRLTDDLLDKARALGRRGWTVDARADETVVADGHRLTQAVLQLADNAVKFTEPGTTIAIGSSVVDGIARLWVRDEGPGIPPEDRARIFDRFVRGEGTQGTRGSGLGLAIVRAIAQGHGGDVTASDGVEGARRRSATDGRGLRVTLAWPAAVEPAEVPGEQYVQGST